MEDHQLVPDVLDSVPVHQATVVYSSNVSMSMGNELTPTQVLQIPVVKWPTENNTLYTVLFTDPDAPSRATPAFREMLHWLVCNVPRDEISKGDTYAAYRGSHPPDGTGLHRYLLTIFKQPGRIDPAEYRLDANQRDQRRSFSTRSFIAKYNLGQPIAGNFYQAQCDDYVREFYQNLVQTK